VAPTLPPCPAPTPAPELLPSPAAVTSPSLTPALAGAVPCLHSLEEVFAAPVGDLPTREALLAEYPGESQSNTLYRAKPFKELRTVTWDSLPPIGEAARLCLQGPFGLERGEATIERQRGCFLAIRGEWERYLATVPDARAEAHFTRARALYALALAGLGRKDGAWLDAALRRELPLVTPAGSPDELGLRATDVSESRFLASRQRPVSAGSFLRAIRDAQAVDRVYAPAHLTVRPAEEVGRLVNVRAAGPAVERREVLPGGRLGDRQAPRGARASPPRCTRAGPRAGAGWGAGGEGRTRR